MSCKKSSCLVLWSRNYVHIKWRCSNDISLASFKPTVKVILCSECVFCHCAAVIKLTTYIMRITDSLRPFMVEQCLQHYGIQIYKPFIITYFNSAFKKKTNRVARFLWVLSEDISCEVCIHRVSSVRDTTRSRSCCSSEIGRIRQPKRINAFLHHYSSSWIFWLHILTQEKWPIRKSICLVYLILCESTVTQWVDSPRNKCNFHWVH